LEGTKNASFDHQADSVFCIFSYPESKTADDIFVSGSKLDFMAILFPSGRRSQLRDSDSPSQQSFARFFLWARQSLFGECDRFFVTHIADRPLLSIVNRPWSIV
jgi:hypothetical protein